MYILFAKMKKKVSSRTFFLVTRPLHRKHYNIIFMGSLMTVLAKYVGHLNMTDVKCCKGINNVRN